MESKSDTPSRALSSHSLSECGNFHESQKIADGVYFIKAKGHTNGNSIVIVENDGLFYMLHGDITYMDEALYENKLSIVFEDVAAARETLYNSLDFFSGLGRFSVSFFLSPEDGYARS